MRIGNSKSESYKRLHARRAARKRKAVERIKQLAPFNLLDGAWLRNIGCAGPQDQVHALLHEGKFPAQGMKDLMGRQLRAEEEV